MTEEEKNQLGENKLFAGYRRGRGASQLSLGRVSLGLLQRGVFLVKASLKEFDKRSRHLPFGDNFINSNGLVS